MNEQFEGENVERQESAESQEYNAFRTAEEEKSRILAEMDEIFASTPDRLEAEKIILETLAPKMDEAIKKSRQAFYDWLNENQRP